MSEQKQSKILVALCINLHDYSAYNSQHRFCQAKMMDGTTFESRCLCDHEDNDVLWCIGNPDSKMVEPLTVCNECGSFPMILKESSCCDPYAYYYIIQCSNESCDSNFQTEFFQSIEGAMEYWNSIMKGDQHGER